MQQEYVQYVQPRAPAAQGPGPAAAAVAFVASAAAAYTARAHLFLPSCRLERRRRKRKFKKPIKEGRGREEPVDDKYHSKFSRSLVGDFYGASDFFKTNLR